jgi:C-terminal processing protease CtpA/Prc
MRTVTAFTLVTAFALALVHGTRAEEERGYIGVMIKKSTEGIEVTAVVGDSPAAKAGLKEGDVIKKLDGEEVATVALEDFVKKIKDFKPGKEIKLVILRDGKDKEIKVKVGKVGE